MQSKLIVIALGLCMGCSVVVAGKNNDSTSSSPTVTQVSRGGGVEWVEEAGIIQRKELTAGGPEGGIEEAGNRHAQEISDGGAEEGVQEAGKVGGVATAEAGSVEADQAEEVEKSAGKSESELMAEVRKHLDGRTTDTTDSSGYMTSTSQLKVLGNNIEYHDQYDNSFDEVGWSHIAIISIQDLESVELKDWYGKKEGLRFNCKKTVDCVRIKRKSYSSYRGDEEDDFVSAGTSFPGRSDFLDLLDEQTAKNAVNALNNLIDHYNQNGGNTAGQPVKCYNWVNLGNFHLGTWKNGNGRETSGLPAGSGIKIWDDETLLKDYKAARQHCVSGANGAMDSAVSAMVLIGRQASDVDNEKKRIRSFYKANLDKCQAEFKRRFKKYENKFCD